MEFIKKIFKKIGGVKKEMDNKNELNVRIQNWYSSKEYQDVKKSVEYYQGKQDILARVKKAIGENGELIPLKNAINNKIVDNMYMNGVDQKVSYLLSKTPTLKSENIEILKNLDDVFLKKLYQIGEDVYVAGAGYLYIFFDGDKIKFKRFNPQDCIPIWEDEEKEQLKGFARVYSTQVIEGNFIKEVNKVEYYTQDKIEIFSYDNGVGRKEAEHSYLNINGKSFGWGKIPIICFRTNGVPLLNRVKSIQDSINEVLSDFKNEMEESHRTTILVIKGYGGADGTFRKNLNTFGYIPVDEDGGVDTLKVEVNSSNYESILRLLRKSFIENIKGYDAKSDKIMGNANQMNIKSMYSDIDLDSSILEREIKRAFTELKYFFEMAYKTKIKDFDIVFNKDIMINEAEVIENCKNSMGVISKRTILENHSWVNDVDEELKRLEEEKKQELDLYGDGDELLGE